MYVAQITMERSCGAYRLPANAVTIMLQAHPTSASVLTLDGNYPLMIACESSASVRVVFELLKMYPDLIQSRNVASIN